MTTLTMALFLGFGFAVIRIAHAKRRLRIGLVSLLPLPFVLTFYDTVFESQPTPTMPTTIIEPKDEDLSPDDVTGYAVRVLIFRNGDFETPHLWQELIVNSRKESRRIRTVGEPSVDLGDLGSLVLSLDTQRLSDTRRGWKATWFTPCHVQPVGSHLRVRTSWTRRAKDLDGTLPTATLACRLRSSGFGRLLERYDDYAVHVIPVPLGPGGAAKTSRSEWWRQNGSRLSDNCSVIATQACGEPIASPTLRFVVANLAPVTLGLTALVALALVNGKPLALRDLCLGSFVWLTLALLTQRGVESIHTVRLTDDRPEIRRRAVYHLLEERQPRPNAQQLALKALKDADRRVVCAALRGMLAHRTAADLGVEALRQLAEIEQGNDLMLTRLASEVRAAQVMATSRRLP